MPLTGITIKASKPIDIDLLMPKLNRFSDYDNDNDNDNDPLLRRLPQMKGPVLPLPRSIVDRI
jgi:hypothetical protein